MICTRCGAVHEENVCPHCGMPADAPAPAYQPQKAATGNNAIVFVILAFVAGFLLLAVVGVLLIGWVGYNRISTVNHTEQPAIIYGEEQHIQKEQETYDPEADKAAKNAWQQAKGVYDSGDYEVGTDIPAGTYVILSDGVGYGDFYAGVYASKSMSNESEIFGGWFQNNCYLILEEGQYLHFSHSRLYDPEIANLTFDPFRNSGMFQVGRDIAAGTYTITSGTEGFGAEYTIYSTLTSSGGIVRASGYAEEGYDEEITLYEGEYLETRFAVLKGE